MGAKKKKSEIICRCNEVSREIVEKAILDGARTLNEIFDSTCAGVGSCGGSCRRKLGPLLQHYLLHGKFPEKIIEDTSGKFSSVPNPDETSLRSKKNDPDDNR